MGESKKDTLRVNFDNKLKLEFHGVKVTSDAGLLAYREIDDAFELTEMTACKLTDNRIGKNTQHSLAALLRQSVYSRLAGYEDTNDAERLSVDPAMRHIVVGRFETKILTQPKNLKALINQPGQWVDEVLQRKSIKEIILDMDSSDSPTFGKQEGSAYNGHFGYTCYHPLFVFNQYGDIERALLRNGNVYSSDDWKSVLEPIIKRYQDKDIVRYFRGDAAFANPDIYRLLETEGYYYAIRLKGNNILQSHIEHLLTRPVGRPPKKPIVQYHSFRYQAASWKIARRVVAKVEWHAEQLFPSVGFIVTNLRWKHNNVVKFYNKRGTAEQWIKEGKYALKWTRLSCHDFDDNQVRLQLFCMAYNIGNFLRRLALPKSINDWSLRTMREKLVKIGAKVVSHARYVTFQMAEVLVSKSLFQQILEKIHRLKPVPNGYD
ncbi:MAG: IS1380 family transposase [Planctomycetota bacterium]|jgi:hypothetical protein